MSLSTSEKHIQSAHRKLGPLRPGSGNGRERPFRLAQKTAMRAVLDAELCRPRLAAPVMPGKSADRPRGPGAVQAIAGAYQTKEI